MNLKNYEVINTTNAIKEIIKVPNISTSVKWSFIKNLKKLQSIFDDFSKMEIDLVKKYALKDENGEIVFYEEDEGMFKKGDPKFPPGNYSKFKKERDELLQCDNEFTPHLIKLDNLPDDILDGTLLLICSFLIDDTN